MSLLLLLDLSLREVEDDEVIFLPELDFGLLESLDEAFAELDAGLLDPLDATVVELDAGLLDPLDATVTELDVGLLDPLDATVTELDVGLLDPLDATVTELDSGLLELLDATVAELDAGLTDPLETTVAELDSGLLEPLDVIVSALDDEETIALLDETSLELDVVLPELLDNICAVSVMLRTIFFFTDLGGFFGSVELSVTLTMNSYRLCLVLLGSFTRRTIAVL